MNMVKTVFQTFILNEKRTSAMNAKWSKPWGTQ